MSRQIISAPVARATDPITSDWAGEDADARAESQRVVLRILGMVGRPMSDWHIFQEYACRDWGRLTQQRLRTARKELVDAGRVVGAGFEDGASETGRKAMTWELSFEGVR